MFDNPTDNHTDILVPLYYKLPLREANNKHKLEQSERLHSVDNLCHPMITHTIDSYQIPSQNRTKSKSQI